MFSRLAQLISIISDQKIKIKGEGGIASSNVEFHIVIGVKVSTYGEEGATDFLVK